MILPDHYKTPAPGKKEFRPKPTPVQHNQPSKTSQKDSVRLRRERRMASSSSSGLTFKLHPLVILNISDHYTRVKSQSQTPQNGAESTTTSPPPPPPPRVFGCVIGVQRGRTVEIFNSFELLYYPSSHSLDRSFLEKKQELCQLPSPLRLFPFTLVYLFICLFVNLYPCYFILRDLCNTLGFAMVLNSMLCYMDQIRKYFQTTIYWDGIPRGVKPRNQICKSTKL